MAKKKKQILSSETIEKSQEKPIEKKVEISINENKKKVKLQNKAQGKFSKAYNTTTGIPRMPFWAFIPVMIMVGFVPLIMRLKIVRASQEVAAVWPTTDGAGNPIVYDFFSYYKSIWIMGLTAIMLIMFFSLFNKDHIKKGKTAYTIYIASAVFVIASLISTLLSKYPETSWWGAPDRREGMIINACYIIMMLYCMYIFNDIKDFKYFVYPLAFVTVCMTIIGGFQFFKYDLATKDFMQNILIGDEYAEARGRIVLKMAPGQIYGTLFNPNYVGGFGALVSPLFVGLTILVVNLKEKIIYGFLSLSGLFLTLGSASSAGIVSILVALIMIAVVLKEKWILYKRYAIAGVVFFLAFGVLVNIGTGGLTKSKLQNLMISAKEILDIGEKPGYYKERLPIQSIEIQGEKVIYKTKDGNFSLRIKNGKPVFHDEKEEIIPYSMVQNEYLNHEEIQLAADRFRDYHFIPRSAERGNEGYLIQGNYGGRLFPIFRFNKDGSIITLNQKGYEEKYVDTTKAAFYGNEKVGSGRGYLWSRSISLAIGKPLGFGPDTYLKIFPQGDYLGKWYAFDNILMTVDKPHNMYLMYAVNNGIFVAMAFIVILFLGIGVHGRFKKTRLEVYYQRVLGASCAGYGFASLFNDSTVSVAPLFWIIIAVSLSMSVPKMDVYGEN